MGNLEQLASNDTEIWEGVDLAGGGGKKGKKEPQPPKPPKNLVDPKELFSAGKDAAKYSSFDDEGMPTAKADGSELTEKEQKPLRKKFDAAKKVWDKHQEAVKVYEDAKALSAASEDPEAAEADNKSKVPKDMMDKAC